MTSHILFVPYYKSFGFVFSEQKILKSLRQSELQLQIYCDKSRKLFALCFNNIFNYILFIKDIIIDISPNISI